MGVSCCITTGLLTVIEYHLYLKDRTIAETSLYDAYDVKPFSFSILILRFLVEIRNYGASFIQRHCELILDDHLSKFINSIDGFVQTVSSSIATKAEPFLTLLMHFEN